MRRGALILSGLLAGFLTLAGLLYLLADSAEAGSGTEPIRPEAAPSTIEEASAGGAAGERRRAAHRAMLDRDYPLHGLVTAPQLAVRREPNPDAQVIGWLRLGGRVRLKPDRVTTSTCATGWYPLYPRGWACAGQGVEVAETPPHDRAAEGAANTRAALPYRYLMTREPQVPEYHTLPSRRDQRAAIEHGRRYAELLAAGQERRAERLREDGLPGEPERPAVVARYLQRGFYVAGNGTEVRSARRFVRTVRGSYVKEAQLLERTGSDFAGVELNEDVALPVAWATRTSRPMYRARRWDDTWVFHYDDEYEPFERQERLPWLRRENIDGTVYHVLRMPDGQERYLRAWFAGVAERVETPRGVADEEPWIHVDVSEQTLVLYRGTTPLYATLVSTGLEGHETPRGEFTIRRKFVSDTMANLGPDAGDDSYRIDDVPWTQYFAGSVALHGAFWHHRFGLRRSHGCVNLAPRDARYVFERTWPEIPEGWHGVSTERGSGFSGSRVVVAD